MLDEESDNSKPPEWLEKLESSRNKTPKLAHEVGSGSPCLKCLNDCKGLDLHFWRKICRNCKCTKNDHDVKDEGLDIHFNIVFGQKPFTYDQSKLKISLIAPGGNEPVEKEVQLSWVPPSASTKAAEKFVKSMPENRIPIVGSTGASHRVRQLKKQIPLHDFDATFCHELDPQEKTRLEEYSTHSRLNALGQGEVVLASEKASSSQAEMVRSRMQHGGVASINNTDGLVNLNRDALLSPSDAFDDEFPPPPPDLLVDDPLPDGPAEPFSNLSLMDVKNSNVRATPGKLQPGILSVFDSHNANTLPNEVGSKRQESMPGLPPRPPTDASRSPRPLSKTPRPFTDVSKPFSNASRPSTDASRSLSSAFRPLTDASRPLTDASRPLTYTSRPLSDPSRPLNDGSRPSLPLDLQRGSEKEAQTVKSLSGVACSHCLIPFNADEVAVIIKTKQGHKYWHPNCFVCNTCKEFLVDLIYFMKDEKIFCGRDYAKECNIPRCFACDELIFSNEYTMAEKKTYHVRHFCCFECDQSLGNQEYIEKMGNPICLPCFQVKYAKMCSSCGRKIGPHESGIDVSDSSWHADQRCFVCKACSRSLLQVKFLLKHGFPFCSKECYNGWMSDHPHLQ